MWQAWQSNDRKLISVYPEVYFFPSSWKKHIILIGGGGGAEMEKSLEGSLVAPGEKYYII